MTVRGGDTWRGLFCTKDATGALAAPGVGPAGALYVNGVLSGAAVAIAGANPYSWSVVLPALAASDRISLYVTATIGGVASASVVAEESADTHLTSDLSARIPAALVAGRMDSSVGAMANDSITAASIANGAIDAATFAAGAIDAAAIATGAIDADALAASATDEITDSVWTEPLPGAYPAGTAGFILGNIAATLTATLTASAAFLAAIAGAVWGYATRTLTSLATYLIGTARDFLSVNMGLSACQGETLPVTAVIQQAGGGGPFDLTNCSVVWTLSEHRGDPAVLTRSTAAGTLTILAPATQGTITFTITSAETDALAPQTWYHECHFKTAAGREYCAFHGIITISSSTIGAF